jgi:hypothetical protein
VIGCDGIAAVDVGRAVDVRVRVGVGNCVGVRVFCASGSAEAFGRLTSAAMNAAMTIFLKSHEAIITESRWIAKNLALSLHAISSMRKMIPRSKTILQLS